jgi:hypothetical protein
MTRDPIRDAIAGSSIYWPGVSPTIIADRVRAYLLSDEAVERAAKGAVASDSALKQWDDFGERSLVNAEEWLVDPEIGRNWWRGIARAAILAAIGGKTDE